MMKTFLFYSRFLWFCLFKRKVVVAVDVSGSIDPAFFEKTNSMLGLASTIMNVQFYVTGFDVRLVSLTTYNKDRGLNIGTGFGGGGTDVVPVVKFARSTPCEGLVIFTDGYVPAPAMDPGVNTLWVIAPGGAKLDKSYPGKAIYS